MKVHILLTKDLLPLPDGIETVVEFGQTTIVTVDKRHISGLNAFIEGDERTVVEWLASKEGFWNGKGSPALEKFEYLHCVKQESKS
jgi:hypothetical protein